MSTATEKKAGLVVRFFTKVAVWYGENAFEETEIEDRLSLTSEETNYLLLLLARYIFAKEDWSYLISIGRDVDRNLDKKIKQADFVGNKKGFASFENIFSGEAQTDGEIISPSVFHCLQLIAADIASEYEKRGKKKEEFPAIGNEVANRQRSRLESARKRS